MIILLGRLSWVASFSTLNVSCHSLLSSKISAKKAADNHMWITLYMTLFFSRCLQNYLLICNFWHFGYVMSWYGFIMFGTLCSSCICIPVSFFRFEKFSVIISSNKLLIPFLFLLLIVMLSIIP